MFGLVIRFAQFDFAFTAPGVVPFPVTHMHAGHAAYRQASGGNRSTASKAVRRFLHAVEAVRHSPFIDELDVDDKMIRPSLFRDIEFMLQEELVDEDRKSEKAIESK